MPPVVGIDLGTTFSAIAYVNQHGKPEVIPNREGERTTPSVVLFDGSSAIVGSIAKRSAVANSDKVVQFVKRQIGNPSWKFTPDDTASYSPEEVSAIILRKLKEDAEAFLAEGLPDAVITVPAYFNDAQRKATFDAGYMAGLNVLRIFNEPTAAALAYGLEKGDDERTIMVYDLGGGTFDVTIMRVKKGEIDILATGGDRNLGGFDWDNEVMIVLNEEFKRKGGSDLLDSGMLEQDLRDKAELAKKTLSTREQAGVFLSAGGKNASVTLTRQKFEEVTAALFKRTATIMDLTLEYAELTWRDLDNILLVGGSTRMRGVRTLVEQVSRIKPSQDLNPDEIVVMGAALRGALLDHERGRTDLVIKGKLPLVVIKDINSHSLGVVTLDEESGRLRNSIVVKLGTKLPCKVTSRYATVSENQKEIKVEVTQGEDEELEFISILGSVSMAIAPHPKGAPVDISFEYDLDGIVHVTATDVISGAFLGEIRIDRKSNQPDSAIPRLKTRISKLNLS